MNEQKVWLSIEPLSNGDLSLTLKPMSDKDVSRYCEPAASKADAAHDDSGSVISGGSGTAAVTEYVGPETQVDANNGL